MPQLSTPNPIPVSPTAPNATQNTRTEERTGKDFGEMVETEYGVASTEARHTIDAALAQERHVYLQCFEDSLPSLPVLEPITGYGDYSDAVYSEIDCKFTELVVECANDHGVPVKVMPPGDGVGSFGSAGIHKQATAEAVVDA